MESFLTAKMGLVETSLLLDESTFRVLELEKEIKTLKEENLGVQFL